MQANRAVRCKPYYVPLDALCTENELTLVPFRTILTNAPAETEL